MSLAETLQRLIDTHDAARPHQTVARIRVTAFCPHGSYWIAPYADDDDEAGQARLLSGDLTLENAEQVQVLVHPDDWNVLVRGIGGHASGPVTALYGITVVKDVT